MKAYQEALSTVLRYGEAHDDRTGVGTLSVFGHQMRMDMTEGFPLVTTKKIPFRWVAEELFWQLSGSTDERDLAAKKVYTWSKWATALKCLKFGRPPGDLGPTYGHLIRRFGGRYAPTTVVRKLYKTMSPAEQGLDQFQELAYMMDVAPNSRRLVVSQWDPITVNAVEVPPCQPLWQVKIHDEHYMSLRVDQRSADAFVGLPFDIAHFGLLLTLLCWATRRRPRWLVFHIGDLHIYKNHLDGVRELLSREPRKLPEVRVEMKGEMYHAMPSQPGMDTFVNILRLTYEDLKLVGYDPHPKIEAEVAE
jgi:thymidylate synthase